MLVSTTNVLRLGQRDSDGIKLVNLITRGCVAPSQAHRDPKPPEHSTERPRSESTHRLPYRSSRLVEGWEEAMQPTQRASPDIAQLYSTLRTIGADGSCTHHAAEMLHGGTAQSYRSRSNGRLSAQHYLTPVGQPHLVRLGRPAANITG